MPHQAFLSPFGQDIIAVSGVAGFVLTAIGVFLAWRQMRMTTSAAQAATEAAVAALDESRAQYNRYVISQASRILTEVGVYVKISAWDKAGLRVSDLAELLLQVAGDDSVWSELASRLQRMEKIFDRVEKGNAQFTPSVEGKWHKMERELRMEIAEHYGPFSIDPSQKHD